MIKPRHILIVACLYAVNMLGQTIPIHLHGVYKRNVEYYEQNKGSYVNYKKGDSINLIKFKYVQDLRNGKVKDYFYLSNNKNDSFLADKNFGRDIELKPESIQDIWSIGIIKNVLPNIIENGYQYDIRKELEEEALSVVNEIERYNTELSDEYLESYLYSLCAKIVPQKLLDGRATNVNILIRRGLDINAGIYPNGTLIITTGLLSQLHTEDELVAILAHEIAHYVLDHSLVNINNNINRQKRAEFWSAFATSITAVAEGFAAVRNQYYTPGAATLGMAALSDAISAKVINRLGMKYNHEQEREADKYAIMVLDQLGYNSNALATALNRIKKCFNDNHNYTNYFSSYTHPALDSRIQDCGTPENPIDEEFEKMISFAITDAAICKYESKHYSQSLPLLSQNIKNNVATSDDYLLKASCLLRLKDSPESNAEVLRLIEKAKTINTGSMINMYSAEIIANLRLNKKESATNLLKKYIEALDQLEIKQVQIQSGKIWENNQNFITEERNWAQKMLIKINGMR